MQTFEFEGKTTEEAIENACTELDIPKEELEYEILEPGSAGIFGLVGGRKARVKVTLNGEEPDYSEKENGLDIAKAALESILALIPVKGTTVDANQEDGVITLDIQGDRSGILIGRKGRTLDALQFIVNKIVNKSLERRTQVVVDSENYRKRRRDSLIQMAFRMGDKAKRIKKPVATSILNPHDRRIVHLALRDDDTLDTRSRGDGILKKVLIVPKKQRQTHGQS